MRAPTTAGFAFPSDRKSVEETARFVGLNKAFAVLVESTVAALSLAVPKFVSVLRVAIHAVFAHMVLAAGFPFALATG